MKSFYENGLDIGELVKLENKEYNVSMSQLKIKRRQTIRKSLLNETEKRITDEKPSSPEVEYVDDMEALRLADELNEIHAETFQKLAE